MKNASNISDIENSVLPCPFCGVKPKVDINYMPPYLKISCGYYRCDARPAIFENVKYDKNNNGSYTLFFEEHWQIVIDKWNTRY